LKDWILKRPRKPTQTESYKYIKERKPVLGENLIRGRIVRPVHRELGLRTRQPKR
jgi:hypothetical protein